MVVSFLLAAIGAPVAMAIWDHREACAEGCSDDCLPGCARCTCAHRPLTAAMGRSTAPWHPEGTGEIAAIPTGHLPPGIQPTPYRPPRA